MTQPMADLRKVITLPLRGAEPVITSLTLPPTLLLTNQKISASQIEVFRTIPLSISAVLWDRA